MDKVGQMKYLTAMKDNALKAWVWLKYQPRDVKIALGVVFVMGWLLG